MSVVDRIISTARRQGYTQVALAESLHDYHVTKQTITDWKAGKSNSYYTLIPELAELLGVTADYLLSGKAMSADEEALLHGYRLLNETDKRRLLLYMEQLTQEADVQKILSAAPRKTAEETAEKAGAELLSPDLRRKILELLEDETD